MGLPTVLRHDRGWIITLVALACYISAAVTVRLLNLGVEAVPVWWPAGIGLAAWWRWGQAAGWGLGLGSWLFGWLGLHVAVWVAMGAALGNVLEAGVGVWLLKRYGIHPTLASLKDALGFIGLAGLIAPSLNAITSTINGGLAGIHSWSDFVAHGWVIWVGDGVGILVLTPLIMAVGADRSQRSRDSWLFRPQRFEQLVWLILLMAVSWVIFVCPTQTTIAAYPLEYLVFPFVVWAALRFGQCLTAFSCSLISGIALWGAANHLGPFINKTDFDLRQAVLVLQLFITAMMMTALVLGAVVHERRQQAAQLRLITDTAPCLLLLVQDERIQYANPTATTITDYALLDLIGLPLRQLLRPIEGERLAAWYSQAHPGDRWRDELQLNTRSGQLRWVDFTAGLIGTNGQMMMLTTAYDITKRKQAEQAVVLATDRERLLAEIALRIRRSLDLDEVLNTTVQEIRRFLNVDRAIISRLNPDGSTHAVAESVDPQWPSVLGLRSDITAAAEVQHLLGQGVRVINDTAQVAHKSSFLADYYRIGQVRAGMGIALMQEDQMFGALIISQCSHPRQWQAWEIDLLQRLATQVELALQQSQLYQQVRDLASNLEQQVQERTIELQARMQELQCLNQDKDLLLHAVTHDLRTPVQGMLMVLNQLRQSSTTSISISPAILERMIASSDRQLTLLNSLIQQQTAEPLEQPLHRQPMQLACILERAIASLQSKLTENQTILINHVPGTGVTVDVDASLIQQVLEHLLTNAIQHNPPERTLTIATQDCSGHQHSAAQLKVILTDDGLGLSPAQQARLFQLYVRGLDNTHRTGIGLGLYQCQQIVQQHGGEMGVTSQLGQGSQFWFTLPLSQQEWVGSGHVS